MNTKLISLMMLTASVSTIKEGPASEQLVLFKEKTSGPIAIATTAAGAPISCKDTRSLNKRLLFNEYFMDTTTHFVRERIPERSVHAKGAGAFGYFEVTQNVTDLCKAKLFSEVGKTTPVAVRFSSVFLERGGIDTIRDGRGFAVKFYTEEGNFDIVGLNTPMYAYKDPILFPSFVRSQKRNPATNLFDRTSMWDFLSSHPETLHVILQIYSDQGIPDGFQNMPGFSVHTYQVFNDVGDQFFVRFHFTPDQGIKNLFSDEAKRIASDDPDYNARQLYEAIARGEYPSWTASIQVLSMDDVNNAGFDVFDITKVLPLDEYPLRPLGRLVLNRNPLNFFAEIEQLAYSPTNLVPGILGAPDKVFEARRFAYRDAEYHRLGANFLKISVNCPLNTPYPYNRDGNAPVDDNMRDIPNYYPNTFNGPVPYEEIDGVELLDIYQDEPNNFDQSRELYNGFSGDEKVRLVDNLVNSLCLAAECVQERALRAFALISTELSDNISAALQTNCTC